MHKYKCTTCHLNCISKTDLHFSVNLTLKVTSTFKGFRSHRVSFHSLPAKHFLWKKEICILQTFLAIIDAFYLSFLSRPISTRDAPPTINIMPSIHRLAYKSLLQICAAQLITASSASHSCWSIFSCVPEVPSFFRTFFCLESIRRCSKQPYWQVPWPKVAVSWCSWRRVFLLRVWWI